MLDRKEFFENYWNYYLLLEEKLIYVDKYVEISEDNFSTYSIEFIHQIQSIGSEVDVMMKVLCGFNESDKKNMADYKKAILENYSEIIDQKVIVNYGNICLQPFSEWSPGPECVLSWWDSCNAAKHGRVANHKMINLDKVLNALSALFILECYYLKKISKELGENYKLDLNSNLFELDNWKIPTIEELIPPIM